MVQHYETHHDLVPMQAHHMLIPYMCVYVCVCAECAGQVVVVSYDLLARLVDDNKITPGQFKVSAPSHVSTHREMFCGLPQSCTLLQSRTLSLSHYLAPSCPHLPLAVGVCRW